MEGFYLMLKITLALFIIVSASTHLNSQTLPLLVGGHAHGRENIQALADLELGNFVWIPKQGYAMGNTTWDDENDILANVDTCVENGLFFMISQRRGLGPAFKPGGNDFGGDTTPEIHSAETVQEIAGKAGPLFVGLHAEEMDADLVQNAKRPTSRSRIPHIYEFTDRAGGRESFEGELARIRDIYHGYGAGVRYIPNLCFTFHHSGFRVKSDIVIAELMESLPTTELQLAYLRGGARQFGGDWGIWVSPWYWGHVPTEDKELWPHHIAAVGEGHSASSFRRCLYLSFVSGARLLTMQETEPLFSRNPEGGYRLAAWGEELKSFWDYARENDEPFRPIIPLALLVDKNNGWSPGPLHGGWLEHDSIWGKLPTDRSDTMLAAYLDVLLPGYGRKEPGWWQKKNNIYPGYFTATPTGAFDIVSSDISADRLKEYPAVVLMSEVAMTDDLLETLRDYVHSGGRLLLNVYHMRLAERFIQDEEFLGTKIGESYMWSDWSQSNLLMRKVTPSARIVRTGDVPGVQSTEFEEPRYVSQDVQPGTAEVLAEDGNGNPILLRHKFGEGEVYLSTPEYITESFGNYEKPLQFFSKMIIGLADGTPVRVQSPDGGSAEDISWVASRQGTDNVVIALANHADEQRAVEIHWSGQHRSIQLDIGPGELVQRGEGEKVILRTTMDPEDVSIIRITGVD